VAFHYRFAEEGLADQLKITPYNTNLAAEFWVLSVLHRLNVEALLTLGNKKAVNILVRRGSNIYTVDVKGVADRYDWPADNIRDLNTPNHVYIILSFEGNISDPQANPSVWIIPSDKLEPFIKQYATKSVISRSLVKNSGSDFHNNWEYLLKGG